MNTLKSFMLAATLAGATLLAGCPIQTGNPSVDNVLAQAAGYATIACGIVVESASIVSILGIVNPAVMSAETIAKALCSQVAPHTASGRFGTPRMAVGDRRVVRLNVGGATVDVTVRRDR